MASILSPALSGLLAIAILPTLGQLLRPLITGLMTLVWRRLRPVIAPRSRGVPSGSALSGALLGALPAMLVGYAVDTWIVKVAIVLAAFGGTLALHRRTSIRPAVSLVLVGVAVGALSALGHEHMALATDGGWSECGGNLTTWLGCIGVASVIGDSAVGGVFGAVGVVLGGGLGQALAMASVEEQDVEATMASWRAANPDAAWSTFWHADWTEFWASASPDDAPVEDSQLPVLTIGDDAGQVFRDQCGNQVHVTVKPGPRRGWSESLYVTVTDQSGKPVPAATGSAQVTYTTRSRQLDLPATDHASRTSVTWHPGRPTGDVQIIVSAVLGACTTTGSAVFRPANR